MNDSLHCRSNQPRSTIEVLINHKKLYKDGFLTEPKNLPINRILTAKYTLWNFLPKNLFYQFRRIGNFYFLITTIIQIVIDSPVSPATSLIPLLFVVCTTSIKQGYEDWLRHKADQLTNSRLIPLVTDHSILYTKSENIKIGDIIKVCEEEEIPCDLIVLSSNNSEGFCSITTANLDGETNLKKKFAVNITKNLTNPVDLFNLNGLIECEEPNCDLYDFSGLLTLDKNGIQTIPLGPENLLLRGSRLVHTSYVFGVAVYTGSSTKMSLNSKVIKMKFSSLEKSINNYLIIFLAILIVFCLSNLFFRYLLVLNSEEILNQHWYLKRVFFTDFNLSFKSIFSNFFNFFVLYNYLVPISLYVSLEMTRFFGSKIMVMKKNFDPSGSIEDSKLICNCSDMNEDLGQIKYLFSDKTGTLTENVMRFVSCIINGKIYEMKEKVLYKKTKKDLQKIESNDNLTFFFICLALCNTVNIKKIKKKRNILVPINSKNNQKNFFFQDKMHFEYTADSPDEKALVKAACFVGIKLLSSTKNEFCLNVNEKSIKYKKLHLIEFDSFRKRMSVIIEDQNKKIILICKGAESELCDLIIDGKIQETFSYIDEYANRGLRIMVIAYKYLSKLEYINFKKEFDLANNSLKNRKKLLNETFNKIENNLHLIGATAIEDKLQEDVEKTILDIKKAGVSIWLLTGDKLETAVSVAFSCKLIENDYKLLFLSRQKDETTCGEKLLKNWIAIKKAIEFSKSDLDPYKMNLVEVENKIIKIIELSSKFLNKIVDLSKKKIKTSNNDSKKFELDLVVKNCLSKIAEKIDELVKLKKLLKIIEIEDRINRKEKLKNINIMLKKNIEELCEIDKLLFNDKNFVYKSKLFNNQFLSEEPKLKNNFNESKLINENFNLKQEIKIFKRTKFNLNEKFALILDGRSLYIALKFYKDLFQIISEYCTVIICSRMSPIQKAEIVRLVKNFHSKPITAAIGDGANDVSMIQEANIGFGLMGKEGLQAVRNADFAFSKFKYIKNIMLIDGHFFYERMSYLIHYFFFKSLVFIIPQYLYSYHNMYSGQTLYHGMLLMTYNLFFTATPIFIKSIYEEYIPKFFLNEFPELYKIISSNAHMNLRLILKWITFSTLQGLFIFYSVKIVWPSTVSMLNNGKTTGIFSSGLIIFHVVVLVVNIKIFVKCRKVEGYFLISLFGSILSLPIFVYLYSSFQWNFLDDELYGQYNSLVSSVSFWVTIFAITFFAILPDLMYSVIETSFQIRLIKQLILNRNEKKFIF